MRSHYQTLKDAELLLKKFGAPNKPAGGKYEMWPRCPGLSFRRAVEHDTGDEAMPEREAEVGRWGSDQRHDQGGWRGQGKQAVDGQRTPRDGG